ncbi:MAG: hypothetical protein JXR77_14220, partial [Lentisphaeria bacterium]|nr:hypothetical protein [Lentisphaeria bacterium]
GAGPALSDSPLGRASIWIDALQLEEGTAPSDYAPRCEIESELAWAATAAEDAREGGKVMVLLRNHTPESRRVEGRLTGTDFSDGEVFSRRVEAEVGAGASLALPVADLWPGDVGFCRVRWEPEGHRAPYGQSLRLAPGPRYPDADSVFGMNHAYPWDHLLQRCRDLGLLWMRDWSLKWHTVEPEAGRWDFSLTDPQVDRVLRAGLQPLILFPFPSAPWSSGADPGKIRELSENNDYLLRRNTVACPARDENLFRNYIAQCVRRCGDRVTHYQIMNEPLYTTYAVPQRFGYAMADYLAILKAAYETVKAEQPDALVVGGMGTWAGTHWVHDFIAAGGLQWCDIMDIHLYPAAIPPENYEDELAACHALMTERGEAKPIWLTEFGCYADDDPYTTPHTVGDSSMSRSDWRTERRAAEALVKTTAVFLTHGVTKIFFHAGTCGEVNRESAGGVFFEYDGGPRKMAAAVRACALRLGPSPLPLPPTVVRDGLRAYLFRGREGELAIAWSGGEQATSLVLPPGVSATDLVGRTLPGPAIEVGTAPVYLQGRRPDDLRRLLEARGDGQ